MEGQVGGASEGALIKEDGHRDSQSVSDEGERRRGGGIRASSPPDLEGLEDVLLDHGVHTYSIFLDPDSHDLFGYVEVESDELWSQVAATEVCQRWWRHMRDLMPTNGDHSPVSRDLHEVFHLERTHAGQVAGEVPASTRGRNR